MPLQQERRASRWGVRRALTAIIASPKFLYRVEALPDNAAPGSIHPLTDLELASRLSFLPVEQRAG